MGETPTLEKLIAENLIVSSSAATRHSRIPNGIARHLRHCSSPYLRPRAARVAFQDFVEAGPSDPALTISPGQPLVPDPPDLVGELSQSSNVAADDVVGEAAPHHRTEVATLVAK
jgi:hypothetical protein